MRLDQGDGPLIVMLHGINADADDWRPVIDTIGPGYRCIAPDLLGFGASPQPLDIDYSADEHVTVIENTLCDLGVREAFVLAGYSLGADIAVRYAATHPHRVRRLFLLAAPFYPPPERLTRRGIAEGMLARWTWAVLARGREESSPFHGIASGRRLRGLTRQLLRTEGLPGGWEIMSRNLANCISTATFVDDFPRLSMPTVLASGIRDPLVSPDPAAALRRIKPDLEIRWIVGWAADHMILRTMPRVVGREILRDEVRRLHVAWRSGAGQPMALLVGPEGVEAWRPLARVLAERFDVALIELLGFGGSPAPLTLRYDMGDHVAAMELTVRCLWPGASNLRVAGFGIGATIGLGLAAHLGERVASVTAFSPACRDPGHTAEESVRSPAAARLLARYEQVAAMARDERARGLAGQALERRITPFFLTLRATVLDVDMTEVIRRSKARLKLVLPSGDPDAPREWARGLALAGRIDLSEPTVERDAVFTHPGLMVAELEPALSGRAEAPGRSLRLPSTDRVFCDIVRSLDRRFVVRGAVSCLLGLALLSPIRIGAEWFALGFAGWIAWSAFTSIVGSLGLRREFRAHWLLRTLGGAGGVALAVCMFLDRRLAVSLFGAFVVAWLLWRACADLFVARTIATAPAPRWALWLQGSLALVVAAIVVVSPAAGGRLLRVALALYFLASGWMLAGYGIQSWRRSSQRVRALLGA